MIIPNFDNKDGLFKFLKENKQALIAEKKYNVKKGDSINYSVNVTNTKDEAIKSMDLTDTSVDLESIKVRAVINTTNIMDSHGDVHINGIWNKSLSDKKNFYLLQEHEMKFDKIITDKVKAYTQIYNWSELGYPNFIGKTEALVFDSVIESDRNEFMFEQYLKGYVNNHSVGMQYVNLFLCINSTEQIYKEEKSNWDKYIGVVANKQDAIDAGFFWAVTEAKLLEGSAVPIGSNYATPTLSVGATQNIEADIITSTKQKTNDEPVKPTQSQSKQFYINLLNN